MMGYCANLSVNVGGCGCALLNKHILDIIELAPHKFFSSMNLNIERLSTLEKFAKMISFFSLLFLLVVLGAHLRVAFRHMATQCLSFVKMLICTIWTRK